MGRRWRLTSGIVASGGALTFLLGLFSGPPDEVALAWYVFACLVAVAGVTVLAVHVALGKWREGEDIETLFVFLGVLLGALFAAILTEAFAVGVSVAVHQGWGDAEFFWLPDEQSWQPRLLNFRHNAPAVGAVIGAIPGFVGWGSRFTEMWSEPPAKFRPN